MIIVKAYFKNITESKSDSSSITVQHEVQILHSGNYNIVYTQQTYI